MSTEQVQRQLSARQTEAGNARQQTHAPASESELRHAGHSSPLSGQSAPVPTPACYTPGVPSQAEDDLILHLGMKLRCALVGFKGKPFTINTERCEGVAELVPLVRDANPTTLGSVEVARIDLFSTKHGGKWLTAESADVQALQRGAIPDLGKKMMENRPIDPATTLKKVFGGARSTSAVHILVRIRPPRKLTFTPMATRVPSAEATHTTSQEFVHPLAIDLRHGGALKAYQEVAYRLKDDPKVQELADLLRDIPTHERSTPFVVRESSSGTGKTQMAFNLQATGEFDVIYLVCTGLGDLGTQDVYAAYEKRSRAFRLCARQDMENVESSHVLEFQLNVNRHVYTFIAPVLRGEKECSGEMLTWRAEVEEILQARQDSGAKPCVVFLDEFPQLGRRGGVYEAEFKYNAKLYSVMINVFRAFGLPVVVSSTNGTARSLLEEDTLWSLDVSAMRLGIAQTRACTVIPTLPSIAFDDEAIKHARVPEEIKNILQHSRPLFVELALEYVGRKQYDGTSRSDLLEYLSVMVGELAKDFQGMKKFARPKGFDLGQIGLLLNETYPTVQNSNMVDGHYALRMENKPFELIPFGECLQRDGVKWKPRCKFQLPEEDMLLHLTLAGGRNFAPLELPLRKRKTESPYDQVSIDVTDYHPLYHHGELNAEALVTAAVVLASHRGGFRGMAFPAFPGALLYEMDISTSSQPVELPSDLVSKRLDRLVVPFLSSPNMNSPDWFLKDWEGSGAKFSNLVRYVHNQRAVLFDSEGVVAVGCMDWDRNPLTVRLIKHALKRVDAKLHLLFIRRSEHSKSILNWLMQLSSSLKKKNGLGDADVYRISKRSGMTRVRGEQIPRASLSETKIKKSNETHATRKLLLLIEHE